jgi:hypothetical protein
MEAPPRSRRRHDARRMRARALFRWRYPAHTTWPVLTAVPAPRVLGKMVSTRSQPNACPQCCANRRKYDGPSVAERKVERWREDWSHEDQ